MMFRVKRRDEIGLLGHQFNRMLARIRQLIQDIYRIEEQKKEAELMRCRVKSILILSITHWSPSE